MARFTISEQEYIELKALEKQTKDKKLSRRLKAIILRYEGLTVKQVAEKLDLNPVSVTKMCARYRTEGLSEYARNKYTSHNRNMSFEQEEAVLARVEKQAEEGHLMTVVEIRKELDAELGRETEPSYVYKVLKRHGWRKVMPRSKHPKAADEEAKEASKKLTLASGGQWKKMTEDTIIYD